MFCNCSILVQLRNFFKMHEVKRIRCLRVVYNLHGNSGDCIRKVKETSIFRRPNRNFPEYVRFV